MASQHPEGLLGSSGKPGINSGVWQHWGHVRRFVATGWRTEVLGSKYLLLPPREKSTHGPPDPSLKV